MAHSHPQLTALDKRVQKIHSTNFVWLDLARGSLPFGKVLVFTGVLQILRQEDANLEASIGCVVASGVTQKPLYWLLVIKI